jgi:ABC-type nitrate/sulfonate/bicarbonate transport system substrate-binding protein
MKSLVWWGMLALASAATIGFAPAMLTAQDVVRIGGVTNYGPVLPAVAAEKLGLYTKVGVKVEVTNYAGGSASMEGLAAGAADLINYFPPGLALARQRGVKATIVSAGTLRPRGWLVMAKADSPISKVSDLAGKKIGITANGSTTDFFALWAAQRAGGPITRVPLGGAGLIPGLLAGNVDAVVAYPPLSYRLALAKEGKTILDFGEAMTPNLPDVWVASDKILRDNPEGLRKALVALYSAVQYMKMNPDWTIKFIQDTTKFPPDVARQEFENTIKGLSDDGTIKSEWVEASLKLATLAGISNLPPAAEMFTTKFVPVKAVAP